jgi:hypothetical protein
VPRRKPPRGNPFLAGAVERNVGREHPREVR